MNVTLPPQVKAIVRSQPHPLVFVTISGAHLYGFASADSDYDLRGVHLLPRRDVLGLREPKETVERMIEEGDPPLEVDLVTHDLCKFMRLMLKRNGYVLEQLFSPLVVHTSDTHHRLKVLGAQCITRHHVHHYLGFAANQWRLFHKENPPRIKPLLYVYRVLLTGLHLMRTGRVEANLRVLNEAFSLDFIDELIERKAAGHEQSRLTDADLAFHEARFHALESELKAAGEATTLRDRPEGYDGLDALLIELREAAAP